MKISIYELLGIIKDGKAPKRIAYKEYIFNEEEDRNYIPDYFNETYGYLFDSVCTIDMLNDEVEILETTLNTKNMNITGKKIEKINFDYYDYDDDEMFEKIKNKINEIIDHLNNQ